MHLKKLSAINPIMVFSVRLKVIQSVMGYVDTGTTMNIYAEVSEARKKQSMETLSEKLDLFCNK